MRDITYQKEIFENWKENASKNGIEGLNKENSKLILEYILDMETGRNMGRNKRGARSYIRMNVSRGLLIGLAEKLEARKIKSLIKASSDDFLKLINDMRKGKEKKKAGGTYSDCSIADFVRIYKAFYNWYRRIKRKEGIVLDDITEDLSGNYNKTRFVYITKQQLDKMLPYLSEEEQLFALFLFDSIARCPSEVMSLKVKDVFERDGEVWLNIPDESSKTYGRVFNLLYCGEAISKYIKKNKLEPEEFLWKINYKLFLKKVKEVSIQTLGDKISHPKAEKKFSEIGGYDFRHSGAIHLRILAQKNNSISLDAIRQRGGWADFEMLNYYTKFIGLTGEIKKEALLIEEDKTKLEKEMEELKKKINFLMASRIKGKIKDIPKQYQIVNDSLEFD